MRRSPIKSFIIVDTIGFWLLLVVFLVFSRNKGNLIILGNIAVTEQKIIFHIHIDNNPTGGVQPIAYSTPITNLGKVILDFENKGFSVVSSFDMPIAKIAFFKRKEIGVFTEIRGITKEGKAAVQNTKN